VNTSPFGYTPSVFLDGYIDTSVPGYREISIGGTTYTVASGFYLWEDWVTAINTAINPASWALVVASSGQARLAGSSAAVIFPDRLAALLGFGTEPGHDSGTVSVLSAGVVSPAHIPLLGATWESVDMKRERVLEIDRAARGHGYSWGGARIWRWTLTMTRSDLIGLEFGWGITGRIRINPVGSSAAIGPSDSDGYMDGWSMGIESVEWADSVQSIARVRVLVAGGDLS